jgi:hypothetical protein
MSTVKLTTFAIFNKQGSDGAPGTTVTPLYGASAARFGDDGRVELLADNAPFHADSFRGKEPKPGHGLLMLYGIRDSIEEIQFWRTKAREMEAEFASATVEFDVGGIEVGLTDRPLLKAKAGENRFLNMRRMKSSLQTEILERFQHQVRLEGQDVDDEMRRVAQIANRPDLFDNLFEHDRDMAHLDVLIIPVADNPESPGHMRQMAYVRPGAQVVSLQQADDSVRILLPLWMTDKNAAKKQRRDSAALAA